jgi:hypothetical protein
VASWSTLRPLGAERVGAWSYRGRMSISNLAACVPSSLPLVLQLAGGVVTFIGLSLTWVRYTGTPPRVLAKRVLGWLPQRKRTPQNVAIHAGVAEAVTAVDAVGVVVTDGSVEARLAQVEVELEAFRAQSQRGQAALRDHVDNEDSKLRTSVGGLATDLETLTAQVESYRKETALSGLGWAAIGVVVTTIGTLLASVPGVCTP